VSIEEHQVCHRCAVQRFIDAKKVLDRCPSAAFGLWIQSPDPNHPRWLIRVAGAGLLARRLLRGLRLSPRLRGSAVAGALPACLTSPFRGSTGSFARLGYGSHRFRPMLAGRPAGGPPSLDFRHFITDNQLQL